jgi:predicted outer membrane repeat protein
LSIAGVSASEIGDTIASENANTIELSTDNDIIEDNLQTSEENEALASTDYDEAIAQTDTDVLGADSATYSDLANEINQPGNIKLKHKNYTFNDGAKFIIISESDKVIDGDGAVIDMNGSTIRAFTVTASGVTIKNLTIKNANYDGQGGAIYFSVSATSGTVTNCNFAGNTVDYNGGAVYFSSTGNVSNCNFADNTASGDGGAVYFLNTGSVSNCNFADNKATGDYICGGAVYFNREGTVTNCNFAGNTADYGGGAVYFLGTGNLSNCNFADNSASHGGAIYSLGWFTTADTCIFKRNSGDNVNTFICPPTLNVNNFTTVYGSGEKLTFDLKTNSSIPVTNGNISISVYFKDNGEWVRNYTCLSGEGWIPDLPVGSYIAFFYTEYAEFQEINRTVTINKVNSTITLDNIVLDYGETKNVTVTTTGATGITAKIGESEVKVDGFVISIPALDAGTYTLTVTTIADNNHNNVTKNATITVNKLKTELTGNAITTTYNVNKDLVITLKDITGKALSGVKVTVDLNGAKTYTTDKNGQVKVSTKGLAPKAYTAKVTFNGDTKYDKSTKDIKVTVKKATPKLTAKKKTFKTTTKTKKYTILLKDNTGKAIKKAKVTLKVKGKTYKATTNSKGKAVFKIKNLKKKGTFKATITYKGNKYYNKITKKANIKVIVTFKTVSKGIKDKSTVKEIQQALKDHGYYLSYKGHYLKVDGKFQSCTERSVKEFQHDKGLKVTGKVDEKTAKKLGLI